MITAAELTERKVLLTEAVCQGPDRISIQTASLGEIANLTRTADGIWHYQQLIPPRFPDRRRFATPQEALRRLWIRIDRWIGA